MARSALRRITLAGTDLTVSRLSFGTGSLHHLARPEARRKLLEFAVELGVTHFDTAPLYGFGLAERALAPILAADPQLTVATKVGLYPPGGADQPVAMMLGRKALARVLPAISRARPDFRVATAERSLSASLSRLGQDRVDLLLLHEPERDAIRIDEWLGWLERERARGRIGAVGLAGSAARLLPLLAEAPSLAEVIQTAKSADAREADAIAAIGHAPQLTYGHLSAARRFRHGGRPSDIIAAALRHNPSGAILVSTRRPDHLRELVAAAVAAEAQGAERQ